MMKKQTKQRYHHGDLRTALIEATAEIIQQDGISAVTMRRLSKWTGVSHAAPYRHFTDKSALLTATAVEGFHRFCQVLSSARLNQTVDETTRFKNMGHAYIHFAMEHTAYYRLMFGKEVSQHSQTLRDASDAAFNELLLMIQQLQECDAIRCDDANLEATYIWSLMHGLTLLIIDGKLGDCHADIAKVLDYVEHKIQRGLQAHP